MTWTYGGNPATSDIAAIRFEIQDTNSSAQLVSDEEIAYSILLENGTAANDTEATLSGPTLYSPAAHICEVLSRLFMAQADTQTGSLKTTYSEQALQYSEMAAALRAKAQGFYVPYVGGISHSDNWNKIQDRDLIRPAFTRREFSNPWASGVTSEELGPPFGR